MLTGRRFGGTPFMLAPPIWISPPSGCWKPAIMRSSVVLPQPEGPRIEKKLPRSTLNDSSFTAMKAPKRLMTLRTSRSGRCTAQRSVRRLHAIQHLAFDLFDAGRHRRVPAHVLQRRFREALRELR